MTEKTLSERYNDAALEVIKLQKRIDKITGCVGLDCAGCTEVKFETGIEQMLTESEQDDLLACCSVINDLQERMEEIIEAAKRRNLTSVWVYAEDFTGAMIGPFIDNDAAREHIEFCKARGDSATHTIISDHNIRQQYIDERHPMLLSADEDRAYNAPYNNDTTE